MNDSNRQDLDMKQMRTGILKDHLFLGPLKNILLHSILTHKAIHVDMGFLTDSMRASHSLQIILRIPIALCYGLIETAQHCWPVAHIKDNNSVSSFEVDTKSTGSGRQEESKIGRSRSVKVGNRLLTSL